jgi:S-adenosylmethionine synthetase
MSVLIEDIGGTPVPDRRIEVVERKGLGHPDTICDSVVEAELARLPAFRAELIRGEHPVC